MTKRRELLKGKGPLPGTGQLFVRKHKVTGFGMTKDWVVAGRKQLLMERAVAKGNGVSLPID